MSELCGTCGGVTLVCDTLGRVGRPGTSGCVHTHCNSNRRSCPDCAPRTLDWAEELSWKFFGPGREADGKELARTLRGVREKAEADGKASAAIDLQRVSAELTAQLQRVQALEVALKADRGDWIPPNDIRVWRPEDLDELDKLLAEDRKAGKLEIIPSRAALNELSHFIEACDEAGLAPGQRYALASKVRATLEEVKHLKTVIHSGIMELGGTP